MGPSDFIHVQRIYKRIESQGFKFFCVGCNRERRQTWPAGVGSAKFFLHILLTTAFLSVLSWPWFHVKGLFAYLIPVALGFEAFYRIKMRTALVCPDCHFDPLLYLSDRPAALRQVEEAWRAKFAEKNLPFPERRPVTRISKKEAPSENLTSL